MIKIVKGNFREIFSLTGAAFNYSSYQHPRRDLGVNTNRFSTLHIIPLSGEFVLAICNCVLFNLFVDCV